MSRHSIQSWSSKISENPTWRDGLGGSDRTYLILAVPKTSRTGYKAIVYGRYSGTPMDHDGNTKTPKGRGKIKFYPNPEALGFERRALKGDTFEFTGELDRPGEPYTRYYGSLEKVQALLNGLDPNEWDICPPDSIHEVLTKQIGRETSRERHPVDALMEPVAVPIAA